MLKQITFLPCLKECNKEGAGARNLGATNGDHVTIYSSNEIEVKLMLQTADAFANNLTKPLLFHSVSFYKREHLLLQY